MTLNEKIVDQIEKRVSTWEAYHAKIILGLLSVYFVGADSFVRATGEQLSRFLISRDNASTTFARRLSTLKRIFGVLVEWKMIERNPAKDIRRPDIGDKAPDFDISLCAVERVIAHQTELAQSTLGRWTHTERLILALTHLLAAGVFLVEIEDLTVRDLILNHILVGRGGARERPIFLSAEAIHGVNLAAYSSRQLPLAPDAPLLLTTLGNSPDVRSVWKYVQRAIDRANLHEAALTPAKLHRAAARAVLDKGLGWDAGRRPSAYRLIPRTKSCPTTDELELAIARHPLEFF
jgi:site-specific recombinase XerD